MSALAHENNVVTLDVGADAYDDQICSYIPPSHFAYQWRNPGTIAVGQRPNPDSDPARLDVSEEVWHWKNNGGTIKWERIVVIRPLKEAMKAYVSHQIENGAYATGYGSYKKFLALQDVLKDPSAWPWSAQHVKRLLVGLDRKYLFSSLKFFYQWAAAMQIPGFSARVADELEGLLWAGGRATRLEAESTRKHVLSLNEERALRDALRQAAPYEHDPLPTSYAPEAEIDLLQLRGLLGYSNILNKTQQQYNARKQLRALGVEPARTIRDSPGVAVDRRYVQHFYRMGDAIPAIRCCHIQTHLDHLRSSIATHIAFALGARPSQIMSIDEGGFKKYVEDGVTYYSIDIPRRKQRTEGKAIAKRRKFPSEIGLGQKIEEYIRLKREAEDIGMYAKPPSGPVPLFYMPSRDLWKPADPARKAKRPSEASMTTYMSVYIKSAGVVRSPKELRANVAQRLADAGYSAELIQEVLDQSDLRTIKAYIQASLKLSEILEKALATHEGYQDHIAKLQGQKIISIKELTKDTAVISGTVNHELISGIGACDYGGRGGGLCEREIVYSCYGCDDFVPFDDVSTHERVLKALEAEVVELVKGSDELEPVKLAFTHQEAILFVKAVIERIEQEVESE